MLSYLGIILHAWTWVLPYFRRYLKNVTTFCNENFKVNLTEYIYIYNELFQTPKVYFALKVYLNYPSFFLDL